MPEPALHAARNEIPREAEHLFHGPFRGPRADRYLTLTRSEQGLEPEPRNETKIAKASAGADMTVTGSIPKDESVQGDAPKSMARTQMMSGAQPIDYEREEFGLVSAVPMFERSSAPLFLSILSRASFFNDDAEPDEASLQLPSNKKDKGRLNFKGETETEYQARQRRCLATAIYFEARGEPTEGQVAVAQVVLNRVRSSLYPDTICGVVYQGQHRRTGCQFSFTCDGKADVADDKEHWRLANELALEITQGDTFLNDIGHATHYHANYVSPRWRWGLNKIKKVGQHIFYRVKGEQIEDVLTQENPDRGLALSPSG